MDDYDENRASGVTKEGNSITDLVVKLQEYMKVEVRSCSMDFWCVTPWFVYRIWGGKFSLIDIENGFRELLKQEFTK